MSVFNFNFPFCLFSHFVAYGAAGVGSNNGFLPPYGNSKIRMCTRLFNIFLIQCIFILLAFYLFYLYLYLDRYNYFTTI